MLLRYMCVACCRELLVLLVLLYGDAFRLGIKEASVRVAFVVVVVWLFSEVLCGPTAVL